MEEQKQDQKQIMDSVKSEVSEISQNGNISEIRETEIKQPDPGGRPTVMTDEVLAKLKEAFLFGCNISEAALHAGIARASLYNYIKANPNFLDKIDEWQHNPILKARATVYNDLKVIDTAKWYLERKVKDEFGTRHEITGADGKDLIPQVLDELDKTDYEQLGSEIEKQSVEINTSLQDQGQTGENSNIQTESGTDSTS